VFGRCQTRRKSISTAFSIYLNDSEDFFRENGYNHSKFLENLSKQQEFFDNLGIFIKNFIMMYADDTIIIADTPEELQKGLCCLYDYCQTWNLQVNSTKTKVMIFWRSDRFLKPVFTLGEDVIEIVNQYTYLGTIFAMNGNFSKERRRRLEQASKAMFLLLRRGRFLGLPQDMMLDLFDKLIVPIALYGCEAWGHESLEIIEKL